MYFFKKVPSIAKKRYEDALKKQEKKKAKPITSKLPQRSTGLGSSMLGDEVSIRYPTHGTDEAVSSRAVTTEMLKIFLPNRSYKTLMVTPDHTAGQVCKEFAERFSLSFSPQYLQMIEVTRSSRKRLDPDSLLLNVKKHWPTIIGDCSSYYFEMALTNKANDETSCAFRRFVYGGN